MGTSIEGTATIITGKSSGLGGAVAFLMGREGAFVLGSDFQVYGGVNASFGFGGLAQPNS